MPLEEAEFHFDVSYAVVKCNSTEVPVVIMNAFNEGGSHSLVGFILDISDNSGNKSQIVIPAFKTNLGDMFIASCDSEDYSYLKFEVPSNIDIDTMKIDITYTTGK